MQNKGFVIFLTVLISLLSIYYLSFTFVSRGVQADATAYATEANGTMDFFKKQAYLDSVWTEPVYNFLGFIPFTYEEVKNHELNLGLDLQGGMYVNLEISPIEIIKGLAADRENKNLLAALDKASQDQKNSQEPFTQLFSDAFEELVPNGKMADIFASAANTDRFDFESSNAEIIAAIDKEVEDALDRSFQILRTRVDRFGTSQPNIQRLAGTRIQVELPGVDNPERVRKLLQGIAKLEFLEVGEDYSFFGAINEKLLAEEKAAASMDEDQDDDITQLSVDVNEPAVPDEDAFASLLPSDTTAIDGDSTVKEADSAESSLLEQLSAADTSSIDSLNQNQNVSKLFNYITISRFGQILVNVKDTSKVNRYLAREDIQALIPGNTKLLWGVKPEKNDADTDPDLLSMYVIKTLRGGKAALTGDVITNAKQDYNEDGVAVYMNMNAEGSRKWKNITKAASQKQPKQRIAVVLDNYVYSAPTVQSEIPNGSSVISGNFTIEEASDLANVLKAGALPAPTKIVQEAIIGPTLGKQAQAQGILSILAGLGIVVIFMVAYYSKGGFVANLALLFNVFFILGILANLGTALTLPGIAGIVLTIGMAIDANVLIFERIREELRNGDQLKSAIAAGYQKAFSSIVDANITTFLTALILYVLGQGPVKGFAITLMIGILCSFFSAVFITRVVVDWWSSRGDEKNISFNTPFSKNFLAGLNLDFLSKRKIAYVASLIFIVIGVGVIATQGLNVGVDFKGGRSYVVTFQEVMEASEIKSALADDFDNTAPDVKTFGSNNVLKITTSYLMDQDAEETDEQVRATLVSGLEEATGLQFVADDSKVDTGHFTISSTEKVGATIADDIQNASIRSIAFSLIAIFLYIFVRFRKWQFGVGAVVALVHDTLVVLSAFAIAGLLGFKYEVDQVFIAAMLTIVGYSINDTVVVFDRIRENLNLNHKKGLIDNFNLSINNTISRTLITSITTMIVVVVLFAFGGAVLKGFSFAMIVGILVGTYSSIFVASPIVVDLSLKGKRGSKKVVSGTPATATASPA